MDAIKMLKKQHREVEALFKELQKAKSAGPRRKIFEKVADALAVHATIEERHFYPAVKKKQTQDMLLEAVEEHLEVKRVIADLLDLEANDPVFMAKVTVLMEDVQHHVKEEREELFPKVRKIFDADQLEALGQEMTSTMAELQKGHPRRDVPLQTMAPMPSAALPTQGWLSSRVMPHIGRALALPLQMIGVAKQLGKFAMQAREAATGFAHGVQRGLEKNKKREA